MRCIPGTLKWNEQNLRALMGKASLPKIQSRHISQRGTSFRARPNAFAIGSVVQRDKWDAPFNFSVNDIKGSSTLSISITCPQQSSFIPTFEASPWDLLLRISQTTFSPACQHKHEVPAGVLGKEFCMGIDAPVCGFRRYNDERVFFPHHEGCFAQLLQLALAAECCVLDYDGCISCASQIAEKLNIKMVVCKIEKSSGTGA